MLQDCYNFFIMASFTDKTVFNILEQFKICFITFGGESQLPNQPHTDIGLILDCESNDIDPAVCDASIKTRFL